MTRIGTHTPACSHALPQNVGRACLRGRIRGSVERSAPSSATMHRVDRTPRRAPPPERVARMFDAVAGRYDAVNRVLSLGLDGRWRRETAAAIRASAGAWVLDLGCGSGRLARELLARYRVVGVDVSAEMLSLAGAALAAAPGRAELVRASAFRLPFADASFGAAASAFVLRNLDDVPAAFAELARVIRPGGTVALADIVPPEGRLFRPAFDAYFSLAAPALGVLVGRAEAYRYLVRSLAHLPVRGEVTAMLVTAGFRNATHRTLFPGTVTLWTASRA